MGSVSVDDFTLQKAGLASLSEPDLVSTAGSGSSGSSGGEGRSTATPSRGSVVRAILGVNTYPGLEITPGGH